MRNHKGMTRGFHHTGSAWYGASALVEKDVVDEVMIGMYDVEGGGGTSGEFSVVWEKLGAEVVPRLKAYDDSWSALANFADLMSKMAGMDSKNIGSKAFCEMLKECGIKDLTSYKSPYTKQTESADA